MNKSIRQHSKPRGEDKIQISLIIDDLNHTSISISSQSEILPKVNEKSNKYRITAAKSKKLYLKVLELYKQKLHQIHNEGIQEQKKVTNSIENLYYRSIHKQVQKAKQNQKIKTALDEQKLKDEFLECSFNPKTFNEKKIIPKAKKPGNASIVKKLYYDDLKQKEERKVFSILNDYRQYIKSLNTLKKPKMRNGKRPKVLCKSKDSIEKVRSLAKESPSAKVNETRKPSDDCKNASREAKEKPKPRGSLGNDASKENLRIKRCYTFTSPSKDFSQVKLHMTNSNLDAKLATLTLKSNNSFKANTLNSRGNDKEEYNSKKSHNILKTPTMSKTLSNKPQDEELTPTFRLNKSKAKQEVIDIKPFDKGKLRNDKPPKIPKSCTFTEKPNIKPVKSLKSRNIMDPTHKESLGFKYNSESNAELIKRLSIPKNEYYQKYRNSGYSYHLTSSYFKESLHVAQPKQTQKRTQSFKSRNGINTRELRKHQSILDSYDSYKRSKEQLLKGSKQGILKCIDKFKVEKLKEIFEKLYENCRRFEDIFSIEIPGVSSQLKERLIIPSLQILKETESEFNFQNFYLICSQILDELLNR